MNTNKSTVSNEAGGIHISERPYGFMLIQVRHRPGAKYFNYTGCIELRKGEHSTSFYYTIFNLDHSAREYSFSLFSDKERRCCFFSAIVKYYDAYSNTPSFNPEVVETAGLWSMFTEETTTIFHILAYDKIIEGHRPRKANGRYYNEWVASFRKSHRKSLERQTFTYLEDIIDKINDLLSV